VSESQDRNLPASARKIQRARGDGQAARSRDLAHFAIIAAGGALLLAFAADLGGWLQQLLADGLRFDRHALDDPKLMFERLAALVLRMLAVVVPVGLAMSAVALGAGVASGGWNWTLKPLAPKFSNLNPSSGLGRMVSKQHLMTTLKACLLALVLGAIGAMYLRAHIAEFSDALTRPLPQAIAHTLDAMVGGLVLLVIALGVFAAVDVPLQRKLMLDRLKMSHQELKQEHKEVEGNVEVKAKVRARMREIARRRMLAAVPNADLVVMNPTHYAVALKYDDAKMAAPRVVAKGADLLALRIRDIAKDAKVPVLQAAPLARALYAHAEVDQEVPAALFSAVAQVLAYVYQLRAALAGRGAMPGDLPDLAVPAGMDPHENAPS
jgi:flagellar biosynthetic protein FlhB